MNSAAPPPVISEWQTAALHPVRGRERLVTLDVLRGFALFGILTVNMIAFSWPMDVMYLRHEFWETRADVIADWWVRFLAEGKFYPLFSFLFGFGAAIQMERAQQHGARFVGRYCRRLVVLLGIGLVHAIFIWDGDILVWYAICGFVLIPFQQCSQKLILILAASGILLPVLLTAASWVFMLLLALIPGAHDEIQKALGDFAVSDEAIQETIRIFSSGSLGEVFVARLKNLLYMWMIGSFYVPAFLGMFLLGMYAHRRRVFHEVAAHRPFLRRTLVIGLVVGLPLNLFYTICVGRSGLEDERYLWLLNYAIVGVGGPALSLAYAAGGALLLQSEFWQRSLRAVAAAGRMALTNYISQSIICTLIFYSYGFGLFGSVGRAAGLGIVLIIYLAQLAFSFWWLQRFQFGPLEWVWRTLTYGERQPLRYRPEPTPEM